MVTKDKDFYTEAMRYVEKYCSWGTDMITLYNAIRKHFPNTFTAIHGIYSDLNIPDFFGTELLSFENPQYVYEAISSFIPSQKRIMCHIDTTQKPEQFKFLDTCSYNDFNCVRRINLILAVFLFVEECVLFPITDRNVIFTDTQLIVYGNFVTFEASKYESRTYISIRIKNVSVVHFVVLD